MAVEIRLMGAIGVVRDGRDVPIGGPRQQLVLAVLALSSGEPVSTERLIDLVWDDRPPPTARRTVQSYVAALRRGLGPDAPLVAATGGYVLEVPRSTVDLLAFEDDVGDELARTDAVPDAIAATLEAALQRWRTPLEFAQPSARIRGLLAPFEELRLQAIEGLVAAQIESGNPGRAVRRLEALVRECPTRENMWLQLARGLAKQGRRDDALVAIQRARESLRVELGVDLSHQLQRFEQELLSSPESASPQSDVGATPSSLPSGRVTFVFTDIEGSTKLLRTLGDAYPSALEEHRRILRDAWAANAGHEINTEGDACFVVFADTPDAVRASIAAQEGLHAHRWPDDAAVRVRMGIHAGLAYPRRGDYAALAVNQAARIAESAHGEQVLISAAAAETLPRSLAVRLHPLGRFRVRDFDEPVPLAGVDTGVSAAHERPPRLIPADGHNLTSPPGTFVNRTDEIGQIAQQLESDRLVTITGPGGVGKTRVAIEAGLRVASFFPDGVWMVLLDSIEDDDVIGVAIADAVGVTAGRTDPWGESLDHLADRQSLLVIDNCEHVLQGCVERVAELLTRCPTVSVLATSRTPLDLRGERVLRLSPLDSTPTTTRSSDAVVLFIDRAVRTPDVDSPQAMQDIATLCTELDGLPLAIELAAARTDTLPPRAIAEALARRSPTLSTRDPRVPARQRSLQLLLDWSYDLLDDAEQAALRRLTVFAESFDLTTAAAAIGDDEIDPAVVPDLVWSLTAKSLVLVEPAAGTTRYRLLRTVRAFADAHLGDAERIAARRSLAEWFLANLGPDLNLDRSWVGDVALELNNLRSLVVAPGVEEPLRQQLAWVIGRFRDLTDQYAVGIEELDRHLAALRMESPERVALLTLGADLRLRVGDLAGAATMIDDAWGLHRLVGPASWDDAGLLRAQGDLAMRGERLDEARRIVQDALDGEISQRGRARLLDLLGLTLSAMEDLDGAARAFERESQLWHDLGDDSFVASTLSNLAEVEWRSGRFTDAARHQLTCLEVARSLGQPVLIAFAMVMAAQLSAQDGHWVDAVRLQRAADEMLNDVGYVLFDSDAAARRRLLDEARPHVDLDASAEAAIGEDGWELDAAIEAAVHTLESVQQSAN